MFPVKKALKSAFLFACFRRQIGRRLAQLSAVGALLCGGANAFAFTEATAVCRLPGPAESVVIAAVSDGDTVRLQDGRRVRLLAFGTLELDREHPERSTALALEAKKQLQWLLPKGSAVTLRSDREKYDAHGRTLAQLIRADGLDVAQPLLESGLAHVYIFPPNDQLWRCYQGYEALARKAARGIWSQPEFQATAVTALRAEPAKYRLVHGTVTGYRKRAGAITLVLDDRLSVRIRADNASQFAGAWSLPAIGQTITVRGQLNWRKGKAHLDLRHPQALEPLLAKSPATP